MALEVRASEVAIVTATPLKQIKIMQWYLKRLTIARYMCQKNTVWIIDYIGSQFHWCKRIFDFSFRIMHAIVICNINKNVLC